jgi:hypothetical protein
MVSSGNRTSEIVKYALLPRVVPRLAELFFSGFDYFAFFMAQVYRGVRLLPDGHPFLNPSEIGNFSIPDVVGEAGKRLRFRVENIDQIIVYFALLLGLILMALQAFTLLTGFFLPEAMAGGILSFGYYFGQSSLPFGPDQDLAFIMLDRVFGIPGLFESCVDSSIGIPCFKSDPVMGFSPDAVYTPAVFPWPFHEGLHALFEFYSIGLLVVAVFIILYFVIVIAAETAQTGTPFGKRFNGVWAPLRLVAAFGLLIPISFGMNSAQYITLYAAKWGSNFATNGWVLFNTTMANAAYVAGDELVAKPKGPEVRQLLQFMMLAHACKALEEAYIKTPVAAPGAAAPACPNVTAAEAKDKAIDAYLVINNDGSVSDVLPLETTDYLTALAFFENSDIVVRFGDRGCSAGHVTQAGHVLPYCGELTLPVNGLEEIGAMAVQTSYYQLVRHLWGEYNNEVWAETVEAYDYCEAGKYGAMTGKTGDMELRKRGVSLVAYKTCPPDQLGYAPEEITGDYLNGTAANYYGGDPAAAVGGGPLAMVPGVGSYPPFNDIYILENIIRRAIDDQISGIAASGDYDIPFDHLSRGWAGAGMWYNHIAKLNGVLTGAIADFPQVSRMPLVMERVLSAKRKNNEAVAPEDQFSPTRSGGSSLQLVRTNESASAEILNEIYSRWSDTSYQHKPKVGNLIMDAIHWLFGSRGLFNLRDPHNQHVHPLAQLTSVGKGLVDASIRNIGIGFGAQIGGTGANLFGISAGGDAAKAVSSFMYSIALMTLTAGITLYYILPFLPFLYFFFAVGNWVKGIFEAMVGVPLWALAHLRIDGPGLPGSAAMNGYFMIFEIFIRPIVIVFGLLASVSIFAAMATVLNSIFDLAVTNMGGLDFENTGAGWASFARGPIDQLFFTILYAVLLYIMGLSSFKLIDLIPAQIMRWMGASVSGFQGGHEDPSQTLGQFAGQAQTAVTGLRNIGDSMMSGGSAANNMAKGFMKNK